MFASPQDRNRSHPGLFARGALSPLPGERGSTLTLYGDPGALPGRFPKRHYETLRNKKSALPALFFVTRWSRTLLHQLQDHDRRAVADTGPQLDDSGVAAGATGVARRQRVEYFLRDVAVVDEAQHLAAGGEAAFLAQRDHLFRHAPD